MTRTARRATLLAAAVLLAVLGLFAQAAAPTASEYAGRLGRLSGRYVAPPEADAADTSYWFTNSSSNSGAFDCYVYKGGRWHKIDDGHTYKGLAATTPFKCDHKWYGSTVTGVRLTATEPANKSLRWSAAAVAKLNRTGKWAVAFQA